jgi:uncharacterized cupredoxin-like copper-binding protein
VETVTRSRWTTRNTLLAIVVAVLTLAALVFALQTDDPGRPGADGELEVVMEGYRFEPDVLTVPAETPLTFVFVNRDDTLHGVQFGRAVAGERAREVGFETDLFDGVPTEVSPSRARVDHRNPQAHLEVAVEPGETVRLRIQLPADRVGEWEMGCFDACGAHYRVGLVGRLIVEPPSS